MTKSSAHGFLLGPSGNTQQKMEWTDWRRLGDRQLLALQGDPALTLWLRRW